MASCNVAPIINGNQSKLYLDLFKMLKDLYGLPPHIARLLANIMYVLYEHNKLLKDSMDNANKQRNNLDQHSAKDVFDAMNGTELIKYTELNELNIFGISEGIKLNTTDSVEFNDYKTAYLKAEDINANNRWVSAYVVLRGDKYIVKVSNMTTLNVIDRVNTEIESKLMRLIEYALATIGARLSDISFNQSTFFGKKYNNMINWLRDTPNTNPKYLLKNDLKMLVSLFKRESIVDRLITKFGGIDALVDIYYDWYRGNYNATPTTELLLNAAMDLMQNFKGLDTDTLFNLSKTLELLIKDDSSDYNAFKLFELLNKKYKLASETIEVSKNDLRSITRAMQYAISILGKHSKELIKKGDKTLGFELLGRVDKLVEEMNNREHILSLADTLLSINNMLLEIYNHLSSPIPLGADMSFILEMGSWYLRAEEFLEVYEPILTTITLIGTIERDINISDNDVNTLQTKASLILDVVRKTRSSIDAGKGAWAKLAIGLMMAENSDLTLDEIWSTISKDASWFQRIVNPNTISNIPASVLVSYILAARRLRVTKMMDIANRISNILKIKGSDGSTIKDTKFMYELIDTPYGLTWFLKSEYDWEDFEARKSAFIGRLRKNKVTGLAFETAMENWMLHNTKEVVVNTKTGRTERVPTVTKDDSVSLFSNDAEKKAYDEFIQLKAEIEELLPESERNLYRPPQLRKNALDKLGEGKLWGSVVEKFKDKFAVREDEVGMGLVTETDSGEIIMPRTNLTGSKDVVPVNYTHRLRNQSDLLLNFAEGISHLAESAINYDSMQEITDTVETLSEYIEGQVSAELNGRKLAKGFSHGLTLFYEKITGKKDSGVHSVLEDYKQRMLYNDHTAGRSIKTTKYLNFLKRVTSINLLTFNLFGAINNANEAHRKVFEESLISNGTFNMADLAVAYGKIGWGHVLKFPKHMFDFFSGKRTSVDALLMDRFDVTNDKFQEIADRKYRTNLFRKALSTDYSMILYRIGETLGKMLITHAMLNNKKVLINGEKKSLREAFYEENGLLKIKNGVTLENGEPITDEYLDSVGREMNSVAEATLGGMSDEALGLIGTTALGMLTLHMRRWMIGVLSEYFRGTFYNSSTGKLKTGAYKGLYKTTIDPIIKALSDADGHMPWSKNWAKDMKTFAQDVIMNYKNLKPHQKAGAARFLVATGMMTVLSILIDALVKGLYPDNKDEEWFKLLFYFLKRQQMDMAPTVPDLNHIERVGNIGSSLVEIIDRPYAAASTVKDYVGLISKIDQYGEKILSGPHKGEDKYLRHVEKTLWKPGELYNRVKGVSDTDELINSLGGGLTKYSLNKEYERLTGEEEEETPKQRRERIKRERREERKERRENRFY